MLAILQVGKKLPAKRASNLVAFHRRAPSTPRGRLLESEGRVGMCNHQLHSRANRSPTKTKQTSQGTRGGGLFTLARTRGFDGLGYGRSPFILSEQVMNLRLWAKELESAMVRERLILGGLLPCSTTLSNLCGHGSFVMLALAYMESDVLLLRGYAASGIVMSVLFQFYRPQPLWIPIGWNGVFFLINITMIGMILKERSDAGRIGEDEEQTRVYEDVFRGVELSPVDFVKLVDLSERRVIPRGHNLTEAGQPQEDVFLIVQGHADVSVGGEFLAHLRPEQFVGSMAFLRFINNGINNPNSNPSPAPIYRGTADHEANQETQGAKSAQSQQTTNSAEKVHSGTKGILRGRESDRTSTTTVTTTTEMVVYAWDFHLLRAFIKRHPLAGVSLQTSLASDLTRKVDQQRNCGERYRLLLGETLDGGEVTPREKKKLRRYRVAHSISQADHKAMIREMGWREDEFEAGFQGGVAPRDGSQHFLKYEGMLRQELAKGYVSDQVRSRLRQFRSVAGIDAEEHLLALNKQGWTADDYEEGSKAASSTSSSASTPSTPDKEVPLPPLRLGLSPRGPRSSEPINSGETRVLSSTNHSPAQLDKD
ncbi:unnamed protein product [Discosporangium mesarthrocarpum]